MLTKKTTLLILSMLLIILITGCSQTTAYDHLKDVPINVDGNPQEWEPFPVVHDDPEGDNVSIEYDISTVKAFANNDTGFMYILIESHIPPQQITSLELDLLYGGVPYRLGFMPDADTPALLAVQREDEQWEVLGDLQGTRFAAAEAIEFTFPIEQFPETGLLKIANIKVMGGICCNQYEYYAIDYIAESGEIVR